MAGLGSSVGGSRTNPTLVLRRLGSAGSGPLGRRTLIANEQVRSGRPFERARPMPKPNFRRTRESNKGITRSSGRLQSAAGGSLALAGRANLLQSKLVVMRRSDAWRSSYIFVLHQVRPHGADRLAPGKSI